MREIVFREFSTVRWNMCLAEMKRLNDYGLSPESQPTFMQRTENMVGLQGDSKGYGRPRREEENRTREAGFGPTVHRKRVQGWCQRGQSGLVGPH
ncbi:hypothetical protein T265_15527, partial [Opisthorchis viverrini]